MIETGAYNDRVIAAQTGRNAVTAYHRRRWLAWGVVMHRIIYNPDYRFNGEPVHKELLLKLSRFAQNMMAVHNTAFWRS